MQVKDARRCMVRGTLSKSLALGAARRQALEEGQDPVEALARAAGGWVLFHGEVAEAEWEDRGGFMFGYGTHHLKGAGQDAGHTQSLITRPEHHTFGRGSTTSWLWPVLMPCAGRRDQRQSSRSRLIPQASFGCDRNAGVRPRLPHRCGPGHSGAKTFCSDAPLPRQAEGLPAARRQEWGMALRGRSAGFTPIGAGRIAPASRLDR